MRFSIALIFWLFSAGFCSAQFTFNRTNFAQVGDSAFYLLADTAGVSAGAAGHLINWDFSGLLPTGSHVIIRYKLPNQVSGVSTPPGGSQMAHQTILNDYAFYRTFNDSILVTGQKSSSGTLVNYADSTDASNIDPVKIFDFPFNFGNVVVDSVFALYPDGFISDVDRKGEVITTYDGDGTLITPLGTYLNVARIHRFWTLKDSSLTGLVNSNVVIHEYFWYEQGSTTFLMMIKEQSTEINGGGEQLAKEVWYNDVFFAGDEPVTANPVLKLNVFPNPVSSQLFIEYSIAQGGEVEIQIYGADGKLVKRLNEGFQSAGVHPFTLAGPGLAPGNYLITIQSGGNRVTSRFVQL